MVKFKSHTKIPKINLNSSWTSSADTKIPKINLNSSWTSSADTKIPSIKTVSGALVLDTKTKILTPMKEKSPWEKKQESWVDQEWDLNSLLEE